MSQEQEIEEVEIDQSDSIESEINGQTEVESTESTDSTDSPDVVETSVKSDLKEPKEKDSVAELVKFLKDREDSRSREKETVDTQSKLSPEDLEQKLGRVKVTQEDLAAFGFFEADEKQVAAFQKFADSLMSYAANKAEAIASARLALAESDYAPIKQEYQTRQQERFRSGFYESHPHLKGKEELVAVVAKTLTNNQQVLSLPPDKLLSHLGAEVNRILSIAGIQQTKSKPDSSPSSKPVPKLNNLSTTGGSTEAKKSTPTTEDKQALLALSLRD